MLVGFYAHSISLIADAFHYLNDLAGFIIALFALKKSERSESPKELTFGWQRAQLLGAFFNGVLLFALGIGIFLQSVERFVAIQNVHNPKLIFITGCIGLGLNIISAVVLHGTVNGVVVKYHANSAQNMDMGMDIHTVMIIACHLCVSMFIAILIILSSFPLMRRSGVILLESVPTGIDMGDIQHDLERIKGVNSVHELHIWCLNQQKNLASVHVVVSEDSVEDFMKTARVINECFHAYGIHSITLQPELSEEVDEVLPGSPRCQVTCGTV
ncbi:hypothetical protein AAEP93_010246 [Penicillium crustosum]